MSWLRLVLTTKSCWLSSTSVRAFPSVEPKTYRTVDLYDILMTSSWFSTHCSLKGFDQRYGGICLLWLGMTMLLISSPISILRDDINEQHFFIGGCLLFGFWLLQFIHCCLYLRHMCLLGIPVFSPGPFCRVTPSAFTVSLILMYTCSTSPTHVLTLP